ncbi:uncharacterized protein LOC133900918 isoform X3 [Phragmites australis]|uniref:uncharacterized protein LOC133900918 isoform X3 n=1 Tax=Phragmites australis TaxID=29695 RepID=UPI002D793B5D|nr:uncharacterized protein LOC133900918 isoform X3 [Phragmites australis]
MCGRARCTLSPAQAARAFGFPTTTTTASPAGGGGCGDAPAVPTLHLDRFRPSYNVSPGVCLPVGTVRARPAGGDGAGGAEGEGPVIQCMKWGLVPSFTGKTEKPDHFRMFNARSESVKEKSSFQRLIPKNRCLVAVEGFYEWKKDGSKKQPYYIHFQDNRPLVFAALYDTWKNSEGESIRTFTILTTRASTSLKWLHDRMPVILGDKDSVNAWLCDASVKLEEITAPYEGADLVWYPVTSAVGKTSFDGPECIKELSWHHLGVQSAGEGRQGHSLNLPDLGDLGGATRPSCRLESGEFRRHDRWRSCKLQIQSTAGRFHCCRPLPLDPPP